MFNFSAMFSFKDVVCCVKVAVNESPVAADFEGFFLVYLNTFPFAQLLSSLRELGGNSLFSKEFSKKTVYNISYTLELFRLSIDVHSCISSSGNSKRDRLCILHGDFLYTQSLYSLLGLTQELKSQVMECIYKCAYSRIQINSRESSFSLWRGSRKYADFFKFCYFFCLRSKLDLIGINDLILRRISNLLGRVHAATYYFLQEKTSIQDSLLLDQMSKYQELFEKVLSKMFRLIGFESDVCFIRIAYKKSLSDLLDYKKLHHE